VVRERASQDPAPAGLQVSTLRVAGEELVVISYESESGPEEGLTPAEREVAVLAAGGAKNAEIAAKRKTSLRTVSKQLAAVHRKLGVHSRAELALRLGPPRR
jgi:DNA-binding NarL/FixJ family response regulator